MGATRAQRAIRAVNHIPTRVFDHPDDAGVVRALLQRCSASPHLSFLRCLVSPLANDRAVLVEWRKGLRELEPLLDQSPSRAFLRDLEANPRREELLAAIRAAVFDGDLLTRMVLALLHDGSDESFDALMAVFERAKRQGAEPLRELLVLRRWANGPRQQRFWAAIEGERKRATKLHPLMHQLGLARSQRVAFDVVFRSGRSYLSLDADTARAEWIVIELRQHGKITRVSNTTAYFDPFALGTVSDVRAWLGQRRIRWQAPQLDRVVPRTLSRRLEEWLTAATRAQSKAATSGRSAA